MEEAGKKEIEKRSAYYQSIIPRDDVFIWGTHMAIHAHYFLSCWAETFPDQEDFKEYLEKNEKAKAAVMNMAIMDDGYKSGTNLTFKG